MGSSVFGLLPPFSQTWHIDATISHGATHGRAPAQSQKWQGLIQAVGFMG